MQPSTYLKLFSRRGATGGCLLYSTKRTSLVQLPETIAQAAVKGELAPANEKTLADLEMLVPSAAAEREEMRSAVDRMNAVNPRVSATIVLNLDCNLACAYCFEGKMKGRHVISTETADRLTEFLAARLTPAKKQLEVTFYGGEPLLFPLLLMDLARRLGNTARQRGAGFSFTLVTNGTLLTRRLVEELLPLGLKGAKVTLDGPRETHDHSRPMGGGGGSYDAIVANLKEVCAHLPVQVGGNFTHENYLHFPRLLDDLTQQGIGPDLLSLVKFDPVTRPAANAGLPDFAGGCASTDEPWLPEASLYLREEILRRGYRASRLRATPCVVEIDDEFTVNWDGTLYKCPTFIGWPGLAIGTVREGLRDYRRSQRLGSWKNDACLACAYLPLCFGGCRYLQLLRQGNLEGVDCHKAYLDATLERMIDQDIRYRLAG